MKVLPVDINIVQDAAVQTNPIDVNVVGSVVLGAEVEIKNDSGSPIPISATTLPLPTGASTAALQTALNALLADVATETTLLAVLANQQTDALTDTQLRATPVPVSGTLSVSEPVSIDDNGGSITVDATDLDIRNLSQTQDSVLIYGSDDGGTTKRVIKTDAGGAIQIDLEVSNVTVTNAAGASAVNIQDGGNSITVDAPVGTPANVQVGDGTRTATVRDTGSNDSLNVSIVDASGNQITTFGGGAFKTRSDTYTVAASGTTVDASASPLQTFSIQVKGTGAAASNWNVRLEGSLDNVNFTTILTHKKSTGDGEVLFNGADFAPILYFRSRCDSVTLGGATNLIVTILGL